MINDFKACGGLLMVAAGFRILKLKMFPVVDMVPAMILLCHLVGFGSMWFYIYYKIFFEKIKDS